MWARFLDWLRPVRVVQVERVELVHVFTREPINELVKECRWCFESIRARATRCPFCTGAN